METSTLQLLVFGALGLVFVGLAQYLNMRGPQASDDIQRIERDTSSASL